MKALLITATWLLCIQALSQALEPKASQSTVTFKIKNFGVMVDGSFSGLKGDIVFDEKNLSNASFKVSVDATTIRTGIDMRDNHLRKEDYFDVKNHNSIRFESVKVEAGPSGQYWITGNLTIKKVSKQVKFLFTAEKSLNGYTFKGSFVINRRDFTVGGSSFSLADTVTVYLLVQAAPR
jgi:polyisoprenoid-binding protein YceI